MAVHEGDETSPDAVASTSKALQLAPAVGIVGDVFALPHMRFWRQGEWSTQLRKALRRSRQFIAVPESVPPTGGITGVGVLT